MEKTYQNNWMMYTKYLSLLLLLVLFSSKLMAMNVNPGNNLPQAEAKGTQVAFVYSNGHGRGYYNRGYNKGRYYNGRYYNPRGYNYHNNRTIIVNPRYRQCFKVHGPRGNYIRCN